MLLIPLLSGNVHPAGCWKRNDALAPNAEAMGKWKNDATTNAMEPAAITPIKCGSL